LTFWATYGRIRKIDKGEKMETCSSLLMVSAVLFGAAIACVFGFIGFIIIDWVKSSKE